MQIALVHPFNRYGIVHQGLARRLLESLAKYSAVDKKNRFVQYVFETSRGTRGTKLVVLVNSSTEFFRLIKNEFGNLFTLIHGQRDESAVLHIHSFEAESAKHASDNIWPLARGDVRPCHKLLVVSTNVPGVAQHIIDAKFDLPISVVGSSDAAFQSIRAVLQLISEIQESQ